MCFLITTFCHHIGPSRCISTVKRINHSSMCLFVCVLTRMWRMRSTRYMNESASFSSPKIRGKGVWGSFMGLNMITISSLSLLTNGNALWPLLRFLVEWEEVVEVLSDGTWLEEDIQPELYSNLRGCSLWWNQLRWNFRIKPKVGMEEAKV